MAEGTEPIDTLYVDLAVRTEKLQNDVTKALEDFKRQFQKQMGDTVDEGEKKINSLGQTVKSVFMSMGSVLLQTNNPLAAITSGLATFRAGLASAVAGGEEWAVGLAGLIGPISAVIGVLALMGAGLQQVIGFLKATGAEGLQLAARVDTLKTGLEVAAKNAGMSFEAVSQKALQLQHFGITVTESMQSLMQFLSQGLPVDNIEKLARAAQDMAVAFGRNSSEQFQHFTYAIMTMNSQVLRYAGVMETADQMVKKYAESVHKSANELTQQERQLAVVNGVIEYAAKYTGLYEKSMESLGKRMGSLERYVQDAKTAFGQALLPVLDLNVSAAERFWKAFRTLFVEIQNGVQVLDSDGNPKLTKFGQLIFDAARKIEEALLPVIIKLIKAMTDLADYIVNVLPLLDNFAKLISKDAAVIKDLFDINAFKILDDIYVRITGHQSVLEVALLKTTEALSHLGQAAAISGGLVFGLMSVLTDFYDQLDRIAKGQTLRSIDEINERADAAFRKAAARLAGIKLATPDLTTDDVIERIRANRAEGIVAPTKPPDEGAAAKQAAAIQGASRSLFDIGEATKKQQDDANKARIAAQQKAFDDYDKQRLKNTEELNKQIASLQESRDKQASKLYKSYIDGLAKIDVEYQKAKGKLDEDFYKKQEDEKANFLFEMHRLDEDYSYDLQKAVGQRDARAILDLMHQHEVAKERNQEDFDRKQQEEADNHQETLNQLDQREQETKDALLVSYGEQLDNLREAYDEQLTALNVHYNDVQTQLKKSYDDQLVAINDGYVKQKAAITAGEQEKLDSLAKGLADQHELTAGQLYGLVQLMQKTYGIGGDIDQVMVAFNDRMKQNTAFESFVSTIKGLAAYYDLLASGKVPKVEGGDKTTIGTQIRQYGGFDIVTQPTTFLAGEGGEPEAVLTVPFSKMSSGFKSEMMTRSASTSELNVRVSADQNFSSAFEAQLLDKLAVAIVDSMPDTRVTKG